MTTLLALSPDILLAAKLGTASGSGAAEHASKARFVGVLATGLQDISRKVLAGAMTVSWAPTVAVTAGESSTAGTGGAAAAAAAGVAAIGTSGPYLALEAMMQSPGGSSADTDGNGGGSGGGSAGSVGGESKKKWHTAQLLLFATCRSYVDLCQMAGFVDKADLSALRILTGPAQPMLETVLFGRYATSPARPLASSTAGTAGPARPSALTLRMLGPGAALCGASVFPFASATDAVCALVGTPTTPDTGPGSATASGHSNTTLSCAAGAWEPSYVCLITAGSGAGGGVTPEVSSLPPPQPGAALATDEAAQLAAIIEYAVAAYRLNPAQALASLFVPAFMTTLARPGVAAPQVPTAGGVSPPAARVAPGAHYRWCLAQAIHVLLARDLRASSAPASSGPSAITNAAAATAASATLPPPAGRVALAPTSSAAATEAPLVAWCADLFPPLFYDLAARFVWVPRACKLRQLPVASPGAAGGPAATPSWWWWLSDGCPAAPPIATKVFAQFNRYALGGRPDPTVLAPSPGSFSSGPASVAPEAHASDASAPPSPLLVRLRELARAATRPLSPAVASEIAALSHELAYDVETLGVLLAVFAEAPGILAAHLLGAGWCARALDALAASGSGPTAVGMAAPGTAPRSLASPTSGSTPSADTTQTAPRQTATAAVNAAVGETMPPVPTVRATMVRVLTVRLYEVRRFSITLVSLLQLPVAKLAGVSGVGSGSTGLLGRSAPPRSASAALYPPPVGVLYASLPQPARLLVDMLQPASVAAWTRLPAVSMTYGPACASLHSPNVQRRATAWMLTNLCGALLVELAGQLVSWLRALTSTTAAAAGARQTYMTAGIVGTGAALGPPRPGERSNAPEAGSGAGAGTGGGGSAGRVVATSNALFGSYTMDLLGTMQCVLQVAITYIKEVWCDICITWL